MGLGASLAALNSTYSAIAARQREIGTLRAIGFGPIPIVVSIVAETLSLAAVGAAAGALAIWTIIGNEFFVVGGAYGVLVLRLSVDGALCVAGLGWSLAFGAIGASVAAGRAVYMNVAATLREA